MSAKDLRLYFLVQSAAAALKKHADEKLLNSTDLSTAQTAALAVIANRGSLSMRELADTLLQRESAMTTMVRRLETKGLVKRERSKTDRRAWNVSLTAVGSDGLVNSRAAFDEINAVLDEAFNPSSLRSLAADLMKLRELFGQRADD